MAKPEGYMTRQDALDALNGIGPEDPEYAHSRADNVLLLYLRGTAPEIAEAWEAVDKRVGGFWYA